MIVQAGSDVGIEAMPRPLHTSRLEQAQCKVQVLASVAAEAAGGGAGVSSESSRFFDVLRLE